MPRNSSGTYTLPSGNPVVTGTTISSTWANTTLSDIADNITDSLDRSGKGAMLASLHLFDGVVGAPGLSWETESTSGLYRAGAGDFRYSVSAVDKLQITANGIRAADGALATPGLSFISDPDSGMYSAGANDTRLVAGAQLNIALSAVGCAVLPQDGSIGTPAIRFFADTDTGIYRNAANDMRLVAGGVIAVSAFATGADIRLIDGTAPGPSMTFQSDQDTGLYRAGANIMDFAAGGVAIVRIDGVLGALQIFSGKKLQIDDGSAATPGFSFVGDTDTGVYRAGANEIDFTTGGVVRGGWGTTFGYTRHPWWLPDGVAGTPSLTFESDTDTGIYRAGANDMRLVAGGTLIGQFAAIGGYIAFQDGSAGAPQCTFLNDTDTGMYRLGANDVGFSAGGSLVFEYTSTGFFIDVNQVQIGVLNSTAISINAASSVSATAGGATLPANPQGFIQISINGTARKIPYYQT